MALIATAGGATANAYATVAEASLLLAERLDTAAWDDASTLDREKALITATRLLDELAHWASSPTLPTTQALWWPSIGAVDVYGNVLLSTTIPTFLKRATAEYALILLQWTKAQQAVATPPASRIRIGSFEVGFADATDISPYMTLPLTVRRLIGAYIYASGGGMARVLRV